MGCLLDEIEDVLGKRLIGDGPRYLLSAPLERVFTAKLCTHLRSVLLTWFGDNCQNCLVVVA